MKVSGTGAGLGEPPGTNPGGRGARPCGGQAGPRAPRSRGSDESKSGNSRRSYPSRVGMFLVWCGQDEIHPAPRRIRGDGGLSECMRRRPIQQVGAWLPNIKPKEDAQPRLLQPATLTDHPMALTYFQDSLMDVRGFMVRNPHGRSGRSGLMEKMLPKAQPRAPTRISTRLPGRRRASTSCGTARRPRDAAATSPHR